VSSDQEPARLYLGVASQGRGPKLLFLRALQTILSGAQALSTPAAGVRDPADPYLTVLSYFNALRELGGARRIVEDEIREHVANYGDKRRRVVPPDAPFANRAMRLPLELTSRVSTDEVALAKERLGRGVRQADGTLDDDSIDAALATNMISVGLDITRLGLMVVQGQPKTTAEYIQATSRVGRDSKRPGLVVTLLNLHKPRDRTHYEHFRAFHGSFYRAVEATSVTPFAPRALDRALAAVVVAAARHYDTALSPPDAVKRLAAYPAVRDVVTGILRRRAGTAEVDEAAIKRAVNRTIELFDMWQTVADEQVATGSAFTYEESGAQRRLLQYPLDRSSETLSPAHQQFVAARSMRDVEYSVFLKTCDPFGKPLQEADND
jgi:Helicase conserved C-terminal domain